MESKKVYIGLDVGERRVGIAVGDSIARIAQPLTTVQVGPQTVSELQHWLRQAGATDVVVGRPRNQSGQTTAQTLAVERFVHTHLANMAYPLHWQDESVTSVIAEERLKVRKKNYTKADIDAEAAAIILQDFLERV